MFHELAAVAGTGRYHPVLVQLNSDGTGSIRNSNNVGGINSGSGLMVDVDYGEEYITELSFDPSTLTLIAAVPEPGTLSLLAAGCFALFDLRRNDSVA